MLHNELRYYGYCHVLAAKVPFAYLLIKEFGIPSIVSTLCFERRDEMVAKYVFEMPGFDAQHTSRLTIHVLGGPGIVRGENVSVSQSTRRNGNWYPKRGKVQVKYFLRKHPVPADQRDFYNMHKKNWLRARNRHQSRGWSFQPPDPRFQKNNQKYRREQEDLWEHAWWRIFG
jgi:hypothetical protein